jgi:hypothetical protein
VGETNILANDLHWQGFKKRQNARPIIVRELHGSVAGQHILDMKIIIAPDHGKMVPGEGSNHVIQMAALEGIKQVSQMNKIPDPSVFLKQLNARLHGREISVGIRNQSDAAGPGVRIRKPRRQFFPMMYECRF